MNQMTADDLIDKAVKKAIREYSKEQRSEKKRKALHNTKMLLKNYEKIKSSIEEAISEASQLEEQSFAYSDDEDVYINSIRKSKLKSLIVVAHIDRALEVVREEYSKKGVPEKYNVFISCFMDGMTYEDATGLYNASRPTISRWIVDVTKAVSIQLFGVDAVEFV